MQTAEANMMLFSAAYYCKRATIMFFLTVSCSLESDMCMRQFCGKDRSFTMHITDNLGHVSRCIHNNE
jgi:Scramblase